MRVVVVVAAVLALVRQEVLVAVGLVEPLVSVRPVRPTLGAVAVVVVKAVLVLLAATAALALSLLVTQPHGLSPLRAPWFLRRLLRQARR